MDYAWMIIVGRFFQIHLKKQYISEQLTWHTIIKMADEEALKLKNAILKFSKIDGDSLLINSSKIETKKQKLLIDELSSLGEY